MTDALGLGLNDSVTLVLPEATPSPAGVVPRFKRFKIVGIFSVGAEVDSMVGYIALNDASTLLRLPDGAQGVRLKLDDILLLLRLQMKLLVSYQVISMHRIGRIRTETYLMPFKWKKL